MDNANLFKIIIGLSSSLVVGGFLFGYFIIRLVRGYDDQIKELFSKTEDLPAIRKDIEWLKGE